MSTTMAFSNGLTPEHNEAIDDFRIDIADMILKLEHMGRHRSYSLAITKLEEASHWLQDRKRREP